MKLCFIEPQVYGMENRDMWCTQCRWKKACTRFTDWRTKSVFALRLKSRFYNRESPDIELNADTSYERLGIEKEIEVLSIAKPKFLLNADTTITSLAFVLLQFILWACWHWGGI